MKLVKNLYCDQCGLLHQNRIVLLKDNACLCEQCLKNALLLILQESEASGQESFSKCYMQSTCQYEFDKSLKERVSND